jgi:hypothetical protein
MPHRHFSKNTGGDRTVPLHPEAEEALEAVMLPRPARKPGESQEDFEARPGPILISQALAGRSGGRTSGPYIESWKVRKLVGARGFEPPLLRLAGQGQTFTLDAATLAVLGRDGNQTERNRVACIAWKLVNKGQLVKAGRGRYKSAIEKPPPIDELGVVTPRPTGPTAVRYHINRMAHVLAEFHAITGELLSDLHKAKGSREAQRQDGRSVSRQSCTRSCPGRSQRPPG